MTFWFVLMGFLFGRASAESELRKKTQRRLDEFVAARGLRMLDQEGAEVPSSELLLALRK